MARPSGRKYGTPSSSSVTVVTTPPISAISKVPLTYPPTARCTRPISSTVRARRWRGSQPEQRSEQGPAEQQHEAGQHRGGHDGTGGLDQAAQHPEHRAGGVAQHRPPAPAGPGRPARPGCPGRPRPGVAEPLQPAGGRFDQALDLLDQHRDHRAQQQGEQPAYRQQHDQHRHRPRQPPLQQPHRRIQRQRQEQRHQDPRDHLTGGQHHRDQGGDQHGVQRDGPDRCRVDLRPARARRPTR